MDKTRRVFAAVIAKHAVAAETLIEAAKWYAVAMQQAKRERRYIKTAANWLDEGDWRTPPPGLVLDQHGNEVAVQQAPPQPRTWSEMREQILSGVRRD